MTITPAPQRAVHPEIVPGVLMPRWLENAIVQAADNAKIVPTTAHIRTLTVFLGALELDGHPVLNPALLEAEEGHVPVEPRIPMIG